MLIDNKRDRYPNDQRDITTVADFIRQFAGHESELFGGKQYGSFDIVTGYFTIHALSVLYHQIPEDDEFRIVSSEMVGKETEKDSIINLLNGDLSIEPTISLSDCAKDAKAFLGRNSVQIRAITGAFCHAKAYIFKNKNPWNNSFYITGSSNLTDAGLGLKKTANVELNIADTCNLNNSDFNELSSWFDDVWAQADDTILSDPTNPKSEKISVKEYFIRQIDEYFRKYTPEEIYYKILFELFSADIDLDNSIEHRKDMSLLQTSVIWKTLFNYQQKGVISLIKMLRKYNGAILADAVGLGKTFSALAVIKYFQTQGYLTVVLCPKKLEENWQQYKRGRNSRFERDDFDYQIRFHTDLQNDRLQNSYKDFKLDYIQSRSKVLLVIDESHNLRNEKSGRYQELITDLFGDHDTNTNRDIKILMLSATPINTGLRDIKGQFNLIGHNNDQAFNDEEFGIESLYTLFANAQREYTNWCKEDNRTIGGFIAHLQPEFFNLTDKLIVARTRKLIETTLGEDLGFPNKEKPKNIYQGVEHLGNFTTTKEIYDAFDSLSLTAYQPSLFIPATRQKAQREAGKTWNDDVNRERFLVKMMGVLFMKRLESSWSSCMSTVKKVLDVHENTLKLVTDFRNHKGEAAIETGDTTGLTNDEDDMLDDAYSLRKGSINLRDMQNVGGFERGLRTDVNKLKAIYKNFEIFNEAYNKGTEHDPKLDELENILRKKTKSENKKIVVFTAFADTAEFIYSELKKRGFSRMAVVTGQHVASTGSQHTNNFTEVLQSFAPYSKLYKELDWSLLYEKAGLSHVDYYNDEKQQWNVSFDKWQELMHQYRSNYTSLLDDPIDILIATDCLSEGQNLQDADTQVNYDIHWNPVRLIQRFGRIDRIGSPCKNIRAINFWPAKSFEEYLNLETRIQNRMSLMTLVGSETQALNDDYEKMIADNPLQDHNADRLLEELKNNSISDIESPRTLSLKDFSFEVYRQDLIAFYEKNKEKFKRMPRGIYSGFRVREDLAEKELTQYDVSESFVAVVGYPHRDPKSKEPYKELYLMCQPIDRHISQSPSFHELNRAEVLELLRLHKNCDRFVPNWIDKDHDTEKMQRLSEILKDWMKQKVPQEATSIILNIANSRKAALKAQKKDSKRLEDKFKIENFDLIVWEYVSR